MSGDAAQGAARRVTILLVEDNLVNRFTVGRALRGAGYDVREADTGQDALLLAGLRGQVPDLAVVDLTLPDMTGFELCRRLKAGSAPAATGASELSLGALPVLLLSAARGDEKVARLDESGAVGGPDGYLVHPVESAELIAMVRSLLRQRQSLQRLSFQAQVLAHVADAVVAIDNEFRVSYCNAAAQRLYRLPSGLAIGHTLDEVFRFGWLEMGDEQSFQRGVATGGGWQGACVHVRRDGSEVRVEAAVSILKDDHGARLGLLSVAREVGGEAAAEAVGRAASPVTSIVAQGHASPSASEMAGAEALRLELDAARKSVESLRSDEVAGRARVEAARADAEAARAQVRLAQAEAEAARSEATVARAEVEAARAETQAARADAEVMRAEASAARTDAVMARAEAAAVHADLATAHDEAQVMRAEIDAARVAARAAAEEARNALGESAAAVVAAAMSRAEATAATREAATARAEAAAARAEAEAAAKDAAQGRAEAAAARQAEHAALAGERAARLAAEAARGVLRTISSVASAHLAGSEGAVEAPPNSEGHTAAVSADAEVADAEAATREASHPEVDVSIDDLLEESRHAAHPPAAADGE